MKKILLLIILVSLFFVGGVFAAKTIFAKDIIINSEKTNASNVQDALDELSDKVLYGDASSDDIILGKSALIQGKKVVGTYVEPQKELKLLYSNSSASNPTQTSNYTVPADGYYVIFATSTDKPSSASEVCSSYIYINNVIKASSGAFQGSAASYGALLKKGDVITVTNTVAVWNSVNQICYIYG